jgi:hypothetical protein
VESVIGERLADKQSQFSLLLRMVMTDSTDGGNIFSISTMAKIRGSRPMPVQTPCTIYNQREQTPIMVLL